MKLTQQGMSHLVIPLVIVVLVGVIGTYELVVSRAATSAGAIKSGWTNMCLDDWQSVAANAHKVDIYTCNNSAAQNWQANSNGTISINSNNNYCLGVNAPGGKLTVAHPLAQLFSCRPAASLAASYQQWKAVNATLVNVHSGMCMMAPSPANNPTKAPANGTALKLFACSTAKGQVWTLPTTTGGTGGGGGGNQPAYCKTGGSQLWSNLAACGWPDASNTGAVASQCPGGKLTDNSGSLSRVITISQPNTVISCENITGMIHIEAQNVTIKNSIIESNSGKTGEAANGTADILVDDGASATISNVTINGDNGVHACIWHMGTSLSVDAVNCYGVDDGIFSWADTHYSQTTGDNFTIKDSYFHDLTTATSNGHEDGYQTEGASNGTITHNTYQMTSGADSAVAIWDSLKSSSNITVSNNLITGGGFAMYAEDYSPSEASPSGGFTVTNIHYTNNSFSTHAASCVGQYGVWYTRGAPTDGWHRSGNTVLETGENIDNGNPHAGGSLCS